MLVLIYVNEDLLALVKHFRLTLNAEQINNTTSIYVHIKEETNSERYIY